MDAVHPIQQASVSHLPTAETKESNENKSLAGARRKKLEPFDAKGYQEFCVAVIGSVDSSKSSTVGVLTNPGLLDDGNGKARASVFCHPHEHESGRTSDISYRYVKDEEANPKRIITFIDLAGHEQYLRTTISGLSSGYPDMALVCISDKITKMTREHLGLAISMNIPILILFTKIDLIPMDVTAELITTVKKYLSNARRRLYHVRDAKELNVISPGQLVPFILTSNKTGAGLDLVRQALRVFPKKERKLMNGFSVEHIYYVQGYGTIVSGSVGQKIKKGDTLYIGPLRKGDFVEVSVKTLHNDYRYFVDELDPGVRGCICLRINNSAKQALRPGMILRHEIPKNICRKFTALVKIFHHHTTIKPGYQAFANCGMIREPIRFSKIENKQGASTDIIRSGEEAMVEMSFVKNLNYIEPGQIIVFREGTTRGIGTVVSVE